MAQPRLIVLPGMGADASMYQGPWRELSNTTFIDWPDYQGEKTLADLAQRVIVAEGITSSDLLCGTSLGGMVALEVAARLGNPLVILVSSAMSPRDVNAALRMFSPLAVTPVMRFGKWLVSVSRRPTRKMIRKIDPGFLSAACHAVVDWPGVTEIPGRVERIHGTSDWMIRCPAEDYQVPKAGHLMAITHPEACVSHIRTILDDLE